MTNENCLFTFLSPVLVSFAIALGFYGYGDEYRKAQHVVYVTHDIITIIMIIWLFFAVDAPITTRLVITGIASGFLFWDYWWLPPGLTCVIIWIAELFS